MRPVLFKYSLKISASEATILEPFISCKKSERENSLIIAAKSAARSKNARFPGPARAEWREAARPREWGWKWAGLQACDWWREREAAGPAPPAGRSALLAPVSA